MSVIVQKYGGTSVGSAERVSAVAQRIARYCGEGYRVVAVVSAMAGETNRLLELARGFCAEGALDRGDLREMDALVATGEKVSAALCALALRRLGVAACSLSGHQIGIRTDAAHSKARIAHIDADSLRRVLDRGEVPVIAGFQGLDARGNITTLGRGGTDTSAVALAAAIGAQCCEIYTDVEGVYTTDPNVCRGARKIERISYEEMLELASLGAKVLQIRSVELGMKYRVPIHVRSSFSDVPGTVVSGEDETMEAEVVRGVTSNKNESKITIRRLPDKPGVVARVFSTLASHNISVDMIIQNISMDGQTDLTFTVDKGDIVQTRQLVESLGPDLKSGEVVIDEDVVKVSIVGLGMRSHAGVAARMFELLAAENINIQAISTSEIKVSCLLKARYGELAVRALHDGFALDKQLDKLLEKSLDNPPSGRPE